MKIITIWECSKVKRGGQRRLVFKKTDEEREKKPAKTSALHTRLIRQDKAKNSGGKKVKEKSMIVQEILRGRRRRQKRKE